MKIKNAFILTLTILSISVVLVACNAIDANKEELNSPNSKYPAIVAKVSNQEITNVQFERNILNIKKSYNELSEKPQNEKFFETIALGQLIENALIANEVNKKGINVTSKEATEYLEEQLKMIESLEEDSLSKKEFLSSIKEKGFNNLDEYKKSSEAIEATKQVLGRIKLKTIITENANWDNYLEEILNEKNYEIFVKNIDITGYRELQKDVILSN